MDDWIGFTDADLRKLKADTSPSPSLANRERRPDRPQANRKRAPRQPVRKSPSDGLKDVGNKSQNNSLRQDQMLSPPVEPKPSPNTSNTQMNEMRALPSQEAVPKADPEPPSRSPAANDKSAEDDAKPKPEKESMKEEEYVTDEKEIISREMTSLHKFQEQQKMIEQLNKKKKQMLATAIQQRQKKAKAEASKLSAIQTELNRLDQMVNSDVSIIRDRIEFSSRDFLEAQKRYSRAEKEFIAAKMDLHEKEELKDTLTEHLYAVIHQNEMRKAKKLAELMDKLEMEGAEDIDELRELTLPQLSIINQAQTAYSQSHKVHSPTTPTQPDCIPSTGNGEVQTESVAMQPVSPVVTTSEESAVKVMSGAGADQKEQSQGEPVVSSTPSDTGNTSISDAPSSNNNAPKENDKTLNADIKEEVLAKPEVSTPASV